MTAVFACAWAMRLASPSACMARMSSQRSARAASSAGTNGVGETGRVSGTSRSGRWNMTVSYSALSGWNVVLRQRSLTMRPRSSSVQA